MINQHSHISQAWGRTRCIMGYLSNRVVIYDDSTTSCSSPFAPPTTNLVNIDSFPVSNYKLADDKGSASLVCDDNQDIASILNNRKLVLINLANKQLVIFGEVQSWQQLSPTDIDVNFTLLTANYKYEEFFDS